MSKMEYLIVTAFVVAVIIVMVVASITVESEQAAHVGDRMEFPSNVDDVRYAYSYEYNSERFLCHRKDDPLNIWYRCHPESK